MEKSLLQEPLTIEDIERFKKIKENYKNDKIYETENEFVFIHKTNYTPINNEIKSKFKAGATYKETGKLFEESFEFTYPQSDDYIHFSINCETKGDEYDIYGFNNKKYAVVIPATEKEFKNISFFHANDVEFKSVKNIENGYILCPVKEFEIIKKYNPMANVVPYIGESVDGYAEVLAYNLGFTIENIEGRECMWVNSSSNRVSKVLEKYNFSFIPYGLDRWGSERNIQESIEYTYLLKNIITLSLKQQINIFLVLEELDNIITSNLMNVPQQLNGLSMNNNEPTEEENNFWEKIISTELSYNQRLFISMLQHALPFEVIKEEYKKRVGKNL